MKALSNTPQPPFPEDESITKKEQILTLYQSGVDDVEELSMLSQSRPSYVASVLRDEKLEASYFDLYTSTSSSMNVYSKHFAGRLGFKDVETARRSVAHIDRMYRCYAVAGDRAGQHHALVMALTMMNRARWTGKTEEARPFQEWLSDRLDRALPPASHSGNVPHAQAA